MPNLLQDAFGLLRRAAPALARRPCLARPHAGPGAGSFFSTSRAQAAEQPAPAEADLSELESTSLTIDSAEALAEIARDFDPAVQTGESQYTDPKTRTPPPKFDFGPLHPVQPPERTDPGSREFIPGPFSNPRMLQTYNSTVAPDMLTMLYQHDPAGLGARSPVDHSRRLRRWEGESPYYANRPLRPARGGRGLDLVRHRIGPANVPALQAVVVHSFVRAALRGKPALDVASVALQEVTGVRAAVHRSKRNIIEWELKPEQLVSLTYRLSGEDMYHFLGKLVDLVLPRIKDWPGLDPASGDRSGNIAFGLVPEAVALFPEIEANYDRFPQEMIPGCHVHLLTTAETDHDARLLLSGMGLPFSGPLLRSRV